MTGTARSTSRDATRRLLVAAALGETLEPGAVAWPEALSIARGRGFLPTLAGRLLGASPAQVRALPREVRAELEEARETSAAAAHVMLADLAWVSRILAAAAIDFVVLKGASLHLRWADIARHTDDIDLLVATADRDRTLAALVAAGCRDADADALAGQAQLAPLLARRVPTATLRLPRGGYLDLHFGALASAGETEVVKGYRVPTLDALARTMSEHVLGHHYAHPRYLLRHLADMTLLERRAGDPRAFRRRVARASAAGAASVGLAAALRRGGRAGALAELLLFPRPAMAAARDRGEYAVKLAWRTGLLATRPALLWERLVPPVDYMREHFGSDDLRAYLVRLARMPIRKLRPLLGATAVRPERP